MNILFYLEPNIELANPIFRLGALKNQCKTIASQCKKNLNANIDIIVGDANKAYEVEFSNLLNYATIHYVDSCKFSVISRNLFKLIDESYKGILEKSDKNNLRNLIFSDFREDYTPDIVITWESSNNWLKEFYPDSFFIDLMPGFLSRAPYPELLSIDFKGFFKDSILNDFQDIKNYRPKPQEQKLVSELRNKIKYDFLGQYNPFPRNKLDPEGKFKKLILLPLQVSGYFSFDSSSPYGNSLDFVVDVLNNVSSDIGVVVTQYVTPNTKDIVITDNVKRYFSEKYENFIFYDEFNEVDGISQYLLESVDGVATVSSSIGMQAMLFSKPVFVFGDSHLNFISSGSSKQEIEEALDKKYHNNDNILAYILSHMHILSFNAQITDDWYSCIISRYYDNWLKGSEGHNLYVSFFEIFDDYFERFSKSIRPEVAIRKISQSNLDAKVKQQAENRSKLFEKISDRSIKIVSFDIFDTLLERPFAKPADVFKLMNSEVEKLTGGVIKNFAEVRINAERALRTELTESNKLVYNIEHDSSKQPDLIQEIHLIDIYDRISSDLDLEKECLYEIMDMEVQYEIQLLRPRKIGEELYRYAVSCNKRIIITSDMYLPLSVINEILLKNGFKEHHKLYLSSDIGLRKHEGELFDYVVDNLGCHPSEILHIGDNTHGDIKMAKERGINTLYLERAFVRLSRNSKFKGIYWDSRGKSSFSEGTLAGLISNKLFSNVTQTYWGDTHFNGSTFNLGYSATGPMFFSFTKWLIEESIKNGIQDLYFLARDGWILKHVYDKVSEYYDNAPKSHYIYASRRSARVCLITGVNDIIALANTSFFGGTLKDLLENKFGIDYELIGDSFIECGFNSIYDKIDSQEAKDKALSLLLLNKDIVLRVADLEKSAYQKYLNENGLNSKSKNAAIVDIGYAGSMQEAIKTLSGCSTLHGYYFMTFDSAYPLKEKGFEMSLFAGSYVNPSRNTHPLLENGLAYEVLFSNNEGSFEKIVFDSNKLKIIKKEVSQEGAKFAFLQSMWSGVDSFVTDYLDCYGPYLKQIHLSSDDSIAVIADFFKSPGGRDCEIFESVTFDDAFSGAKLRYLIPPRTFSNLKLEQLIKMTVWRKGTEVFFRRSDIKNGLQLKKERLDYKEHKISIDHISTREITGVKILDKIIRRKMEKGTIGEDMKPIFIFSYIVSIFASKKKRDKYLANPYRYHLDSNNKWVKRALVFY
ncbi:HAD-IA family hydrolase [Vibrio cholerae]